MAPRHRDPLARSSEGRQLAPQTAPLLEPALGELPPSVLTLAQTPTTFFPHWDSACGCGLPSSTGGSLKPRLPGPTPEPQNQWFWGDVRSSISGTLQGNAEAGPREPRCSPACLTKGRVSPGALRIPPPGMSPGILMSPILCSKLGKKVLPGSWTLSAPGH